MNLALVLDTLLRISPTIVDTFDPVLCLVSSFRLQDHDVGGEDKSERGGVFCFFVLDIHNACEGVATLDFHLQQVKKRVKSCLSFGSGWE